MTYNCLILAVMVTVTSAANVGCNAARVARQAQDLSFEVAGFRQEQSDRIDQLNAEYRSAFVKNINEMVELSDAELRQARHVDAQLLTDRITDDDRATYIGSLRGVFRERMVAHRAALDTADRGLEAARDKYEANYRGAKLQLDKLDEVRNELALLSGYDNLAEAVRFVKLVGDAYQSYKKAEAGADTGGAAPATPIP